MDEYTDQDIADVDWKQQVNGVMGQAHQLGIMPTVTDAIRFIYGDSDEPVDPEAQARYERGKELNKRFVLVTSQRTQMNDSAAEAFFREQRRVSGPVRWKYAGWTATNQMYVFQGLRARQEEEPESEDAE